MPLSTATREHAELMTPLPPMNSTLSFAIPLTLNRDERGGPGRGPRIAMPGHPYLSAHGPDWPEFDAFRRPGKVRSIASECDKRDVNSRMNRCLE